MTVYDKLTNSNWVDQQQKKAGEITIFDTWQRNVSKSK